MTAVEGLMIAGDVATPLPLPKSLTQDLPLALVYALVESVLARQFDLLIRQALTTGSMTGELLNLDPLSRVAS